MKLIWRMNPNIKTLKNILKKVCTCWYIMNVLVYQMNDTRCFFAKSTKCGYLFVAKLLAEQLTTVHSNSLRMLNSNW